MTGFQFLQILSDCKYRTVGKQQRNNFQAWSFVTTLWRSLIKFTRWTVNYCTLSCRLLKLELVLVWHHLDNIIYKSFQILKLYNAIRKKKKKRKKRNTTILAYWIMQSLIKDSQSRLLVCSELYFLLLFLTELTRSILYPSLLLLI